MMINDPLALIVARQSCRSGEARRLRRELGLSVRDVATSVGVDPGTVSRWERARCVPRGAHAQRFGELLLELLRVAEAVA